MLHASAAAMPEGATALEIPTDRPSFYKSFQPLGVPAAATAVRLLTPPPPPSHHQPQLPLTVYMPAPTPEQTFFADRHAYAYITPADAPCRADPFPFLRRVFRTLALDLPQTFELLPSWYGADATVRFRTPDHREAAVRRQPFELDGATVKLVRKGETPDRSHSPTDYVAHVALHGYPAEQRTEEEIAANCCRFGFLCEVDPACFAAPDLATVHVVLRLQHSREIPRELRIEYDDYSTSVVGVEIVRIWHRDFSYDADGQYVPLFQQPVPTTAA